MKEADDNNQQTGTNPSGPEQGNEKLSKDMKGLVYQGGEPAGEDHPPKEPEPYSGEGPTGEAKEKGHGMSSESNTVLDFTEKDSRTKTIVLLVIAAIIIVGVAYLFLHSSTGKSKTTVKTTSTIQSNAPTSTIAVNRNTTYIGGLDTLYNYTGPATVNGQYCGKSKSESGIPGYTNRLNASTTFYIVDTEDTGLCPLTITKYVASTPGFRVLSVTPTTPPFTIPPNSSNIEYVLKIQAPFTNYTGPLSLTIDEN